LEYDFESDFERLVESDSLLLSVATALSVVVVLAVRLADLLLESVNDKDLLDEAEASREADLLLDLLAEASSEAFADLESVADRLASEDLLACAAALSLELLVPAEVPAVVLVPFVPEPPLVAVMLSAVVPVEAE